jgi:hypothetical protein
MSDSIVGIVSLFALDFEAACQFEKLLAYEWSEFTGNVPPP